MLDVERSKPTAEGQTGEFIRIRGARTNNLQGVDVDIPRNQLVVLTGPSGSGKSSLAFDTLYAEGKRQYIESLSAYAQQFMDQMARPDVDLIDGLQPTICIDQRPGNQNPRSTVATVTEIYDYLRLLMARLGQPTCYQCGADISQQSVEEIRDRLLEMHEGTKVMIFAPMVRGRKGAHKEVLQRVRQAGFLRVRVDGLVCDLDNVPEIVPQKIHHIDAVVDRIIIRKGIDARLTESIANAVEHGDGVLTLCYLDGRGANEPAAAVGKQGDGQRPPGPDKDKEIVWRDELYSTRLVCPNCNISYEEVEPRTFSFNSPYGACPVCEGMGSSEQFDPELIVLDSSASLLEGGIAAWKNGMSAATAERRNKAAAFLKAHGSSGETPLEQLKPRLRDALIQGDEQDFPGILMLLEQEYATSSSTKRLAELEHFRASVPCRACHGTRLRPEARSVLLRGHPIHEITAMTVVTARNFFEQLRLSNEDQAIGEPLVREIRKRLEFLDRVGLDYLSLDRCAKTLSGGEIQRVRLATSIGSGLVGVCYILDEPSIGLHARDNQRLIDSLRDLQTQGNTVLVVEHDEAMMRQADRLIDIGPQAGRDGGKIVFEGSVDQAEKTKHSPTGRYLSGLDRIPIPNERRRTTKTKSLFIQGVGTNNLNNIDVRIPLGVFTCITGVSGSGKSSLVNETLAPALLRRMGLNSSKPGQHTSLRGVSQLNRVIQIDQSPIGRTPRSNPATYTGVFDEVRKVFAGTRQAKQMGYRVGRFSFNTNGGRCESCQGQGVQRIEMSFLPDLFVTCDQCRGARFNRQTLQVHYRGRSIADVLNMSVAEGCDFFQNFENMARTLGSLNEVGLGYLPLGQPSTTLSGGEAQRIKLATELASVDSGKTLYLLDEPTTGLHFQDIQRLLNVLNGLVDKGNSVLVIEHNLEVVKSADWVIDLGPEGGQRGGFVVAEGTPEELAQCAASYTGCSLQPYLDLAAAMGNQRASRVAAE